MSDVITNEEIKSCFQYLDNIQYDPEITVIKGIMRSVAQHIMGKEYSHQMFELAKAVVEHYIPGGDLQDYKSHQDKGLVL